MTATTDSSSSTTIAPPACTRRCQHQPTPGAAPPPCWANSASHRDRLHHAAVVLAHHGIAVIPRCEGDPEQVRKRITEVLHARWPHGTGCYMFWTAADDHAAFTPYGTLTSALVLHHTADTHTAITAALDAVGLTHQPGAHPRHTTRIPAQ